MPKLNNKGMTVVELLASFIIISILVVGMLEVVFSYREKASTSTEESKVIEYQNNITRDIMVDILDKKVDNVTSCGTKCVNITFMDSTSKKIEIPNINSYELYKNKYISYGGRQYIITENIPEGVDNPASYQNINFANAITLKTDTVGSDVLYSIDFSITHINLDKDYGLHLRFFKG